MWLISLMLIGYGIFHKAIDTFCQSGFGKILKYSFFAGVAVFIGLFIFVAISGYTHSAHGDEKAIVVLGAGLRGENVSNFLQRRLQAALQAHHENPDAYIVVTGGQGPQEIIPEALAMQRWLLHYGVPEDKIIVEDKSTSTEENLLFAKALLAEKGISPNEPMAVVTNAFHIYRATQYAGKVGFTNVRSVPASITITAVLPSYLREVLAVLYFWVFKQ